MLHIDLNEVIVHLNEVTVHLNNDLSLENNESDNVDLKNKFDVNDSQLVCGFDLSNEIVGDEVEEGH